MRNTRLVELLARFNPATSRFDSWGTGGGGPVIGQAEIADALNAISDKVGGAILCCAAWPSSRAIYMQTLVEYARQVLAAEHTRRFEIYRAAEAEWLANTYRDPDMLDAQRRKIALDAAKRTLWPEWIKNQRRYTKLPQAVVAELTNCPTVCFACNGNRTVRRFGEEVDCDVCDGTGVYRAPSAHRAKAIGVHRKTYHDAWRQPYEYIYDDLVGRMWDAAAEFGAQVRRNIEAA